MKTLNFRKVNAHIADKFGDGVARVVGTHPFKDWEYELQILVGDPNQEIMKAVSEYLTDEFEFRWQWDKAYE